MKNNGYFYNLDFDQSDCNFVIKQEERKVICIIEGTAPLFFNYMSRKLPEELSAYYIMGGVAPAIEQKLVMPNRFVGIATCSEEDEWNEETGCLIAFERAKEKVVSSFFKRVNTFIAYQQETLNALTTCFSTESVRAQADIAHRNEYIETKIGAPSQPYRNITYFG